MACYTRAELIFAQVAHTGRSTHSLEEVDLIELLVSSLIGSDCAISKKEITAEGLIDSNKTMVIAPHNIQDKMLNMSLGCQACTEIVDRYPWQKASTCSFSLKAIGEDEPQFEINLLLVDTQFKLALSRSQCISISIEGLKMRDSAANNRTIYARRLIELAQINAHAP